LILLKRSIGLHLCGTRADRGARAVVADPRFADHLQPDAHRISRNGIDPVCSLVWPAASALFRFGPLHWDDLGLALAAGGTMLIILELLKPLWRTHLRF
jgi:hypothetical protein